MKQILSIQSYKSVRGEQGFTIIELLVSMGLSAVVISMIIGGLVSNSNYYMEDVAKTRIQQNLRSSLDIISMNIRQAGESLDGTFPAIMVVDGASGAPDELILRRNLISDVHLNCKPSAAAATRLYISDNGSSSTECLPVNMAGAKTRWANFRASEGGSLTGYVYDRVGKVGEFFTYSNEGQSGGDDYITVNSLSRAYPANSTSIYIIEEFRFTLFDPTETLQVNTDGMTVAPQDVAYSITDFQVELDLEDNTTITELNETSAVNWRSLRKVRVTITGIENWKKRNFERTVVGEYFPRNVMSN